MLRHRLIVLKFGGSVLLNEDRLRIAVHEIYRWRRDGWRVIAVVSAFAGETDALIERCQRLCPDSSAGSGAAVIANGEANSAAQLGLLLARAGITASVCSPGGIGLIAAGDPLDATPVGIDTAKVSSILDRDGVLIIPGFVGVDTEGRPVTFGRGGSDLTAIFLSHQLGADRRLLIKDVDGLYTSDPAAPGKRPDRYRCASWQDALATDGSIVQHKAIKYAQSHNHGFELGCFNSCDPTRIGPGKTTLEDAPAPAPPKTVALIGHGVVGAGVFDLIQQLPDRFQVTGVAVRDPMKHQSDHRVTPLLTTDAEQLAASGADLVIELIGGAGAALPIARAALEQGSAFITANKALIAEHGPELCLAAAASGASVSFAAAAGGSCPMLEHLRLINPAHVRSVRTICNGTSNYVLTRVSNGARLGDAIAEAQRHGYAERDPSRDLRGLDDADKLRIMASELGFALPCGSIDTEPITQQTIDRASRRGRQLRRIATIEIDGGEAAASVRLTALHPDDPLARIDNEHNAMLCTSIDGATSFIRGRGAGRWPTAEAVLADCLDAERAMSSQLGSVTSEEVCA